MTTFVSIGPTLSLFLSVLMLPHHSGQISKTAAIFYTHVKDQKRWVYTSWKRGQKGLDPGSCWTSQKTSYFCINYCKTVAPSLQMGRTVEISRQCAAARYVLCRPPSPPSASYSPTYTSQSSSYYLLDKISSPSLYMPVLLLRFFSSDLLYVQPVIALPWGLR